MLCVRGYWLIVAFAGILIPKARLATKGRWMLFSKIKKALAGNTAPVVWFHSASLGEFEQGLPVMQAYKEAFPEVKLCATFFSPAGYEIRKNHPLIDYAFYLPLDTHINAKWFLNLVQPKEIFFVKYEYWYCFMTQIHKRKIPLYSISTLITQHHLFFQWYGILNRRTIPFFNQFFVQNQETYEHLKTLGVSKLQISGDTRFDRVKKTAASPKSFPEIAAWKGNKDLMVVGSAWLEDMQVLAEFINQSGDDLKIIIAPHEIEASDIKKLSSFISRDFGIFTKDGLRDDHDVLFLDTIGMLSNLYQYATLAYIGGGFSYGLNNSLEAVVFGLPVVFGNEKLAKYPEAAELEERKIGFPIGNEEECTAALTKLRNDQAHYQKARENALSYIEEKAGATAKIMNYILAEHEG